LIDVWASAINKQGYARSSIDMLPRTIVALPTGFLARCKGTASNRRAARVEKVSLSYAC
jgi:hypothetical protein